MFYRYRLFTSNGDDAGEAEYVVMIRPGETIYGLDGKPLRVLDVVAVLEEEAPYVGLLRVEPST